MKSVCSQAQEEKGGRPRGKTLKRCDLLYISFLSLNYLQFIFVSFLKIAQCAFFQIRIFLRKMLKGFRVSMLTRIFGNFGTVFSAILNIFASFTPRL